MNEEASGKARIPSNATTYSFRYAHISERKNAVAGVLTLISRNVIFEVSQNCPSCRKNLAVAADSLGGGE